MKKRTPAKYQQYARPPQVNRERIVPSTWLLGAVMVLVPLMTGRLDVGGEPVEASLQGVLVGLFTSGKMLPVAIWLVAAAVFATTVWEWRQKPAGGDAVPFSTRIVIALWIIWMLVAALASVYRWGSLVVWSHWAVALMGAWLLAQRRQMQAIVILAALTIGGSLAAAYAVREYAENVRQVPNWRVFGTFFNPSFLAGYLCLTLPVTLGFAVGVMPSYSRSSSIRWLAGFGAWLQAAAILLTGSRFGAASMVVGLIAMAVFLTFSRSWNKQRAWVFAVICVLIAVTAGLAARPLTQRIAPQAAEAESHSGGFRIWTWKGTLRMVQNHPLLGTGQGTYEMAYPRYAYVGFTRLAHNGYLQMASEAGVPALILMLTALGTLAWVVIRQERGITPTVQDWDTRALRAGLAGAISAGLARNLIDSDWSIFACLFTFWAVVGLILAFQPRVTQATIQRTYAVHALVLVLPLLLLSLRAAGALHSNAGDWYLSHGQAEDAIHRYQIAARIEPLNADHYWSRGTIEAQLARQGSPEWAGIARRNLLRAAGLMSSPRLWYQIGNLHRDVFGNLPEAEKSYRRALELDPHALRVMIDLGKLLERQAKWQDAETLYQKILQIEQSVYNRVRAIPEVPEVDYAFAYAGLARVTQRKPGMEAEARKLYTRALQILDEDKRVREQNPMAQALPRSPERDRVLEELRNECERALQHAAVNSDAD